MGLSRAWMSSRVPRGTVRAQPSSHPAAFSVTAGPHRFRSVLGSRLAASFPLLPFSFFHSRCTPEACLALGSPSKCPRILLLASLSYLFKFKTHNACLGLLPLQCHQEIKILQRLPLCCSQGPTFHNKRTRPCHLAHIGHILLPSGGVTLWIGFLIIRPLFVATWVPCLAVQGASPTPSQEGRVGSSVQEPLARRFQDLGASPGSASSSPSSVTLGESGPAWASVYPSLGQMWDSTFCRSPSSPTSPVVSYLQGRRLGVPDYQPRALSIHDTCGDRMHTHDTQATPTHHMHAETPSILEKKQTLNPTLSSNRGPISLFLLIAKVLERALGAVIKCVNSLRPLPWRGGVYAPHWKLGGLLYFDQPIKK